jgi:hypothetical protein
MIRGIGDTENKDGGLVESRRKARKRARENSNYLLLKDVLRIQKLESFDQFSSSNEIYRRWKHLFKDAKEIKILYRPDFTCILYVIYESSDLTDAIITLKKRENEKGIKKQNEKSVSKNDK